jgi:hypothetical protein
MDTSDKVGVVCAILIAGVYIAAMVYTSGKKNYMRIANHDIEIKLDYLSGAQFWRIASREQNACINQLAHGSSKVYQVSYAQPNTGRTKNFLYMDNAGCGDCVLYALQLFLCLKFGTDYPAAVELRKTLVDYTRRHRNTKAFSVGTEIDDIETGLINLGVIPRTMMTNGELAAHIHSAQGLTEAQALEFHIPMGAPLSFIHLKACANIYRVPIRIWSRLRQETTHIELVGHILPWDMSPDEASSPFCDLFWYLQQNLDMHAMLLGELVTR